MEAKLFSLEPNGSNKFIKTVRILFGSVCVILAFSWLFININKGLLSKESMFPILFIICFGVYQIFAGMGKTEKFIDISRDLIVCKQHSMLPPKRITPFDIQKIVIFPLSVHFRMINDKKYIFRFGTSYKEIIDPVKDSIESFAESNSLLLEYGVEEL